MNTNQAINLFSFDHLPEDLRLVSMKFYYTAIEICTLIPESASRTKALNELWQAKNWAVIAAVEVRDTVVEEPVE